MYAITTIRYMCLLCEEIYEHNIGEKPYYEIVRHGQYGREQLAICPNCIEKLGKLMKGATNGRK